jgi:hypothetical protein
MIPWIAIYQFRGKVLDDSCDFHVFLDRIQQVSPASRDGELAG